MPKIARDNDTMNTGIFTSATVSSTQSFVSIQGVNIVKQGDPVSTHTYDNPETPPSPDQVHSGATMVASQGFVTIQGVPIIIDGDNATCSLSHTVNASGFVTI